MRKKELTLLISAVVTAAVIFAGAGWFVWNSQETGSFFDAIRESASKLRDEDNAESQPDLEESALFEHLPSAFTDQQNSGADAVSMIAIRKDGTFSGTLISRSQSGKVTSEEYEGKFSAVQKKGRVCVSDNSRNSEASSKTESVRKQRKRGADSTERRDCIQY